jgi:hypothetical protein
VGKQEFFCYSFPFLFKCNVLQNRSLEARMRGRERGKKGASLLLFEAHILCSLIRKGRRNTGSNSGHRRSKCHARFLFTQNFLLYKPINIDQFGNLDLPFLLFTPSTTRKMLYFYKCMIKSVTNSHCVFVFIIINTVERAPGVDIKIGKQSQKQGTS